MFDNLNIFRLITILFEVVKKILLSFLSRFTSRKDKCALKDNLNICNKNIFGHIL